MPETLITPAAGECIHVDEARHDRRIDDRADDAKLKSLIIAARQAAESKTRQQLMHARWMLVLDAFPAPGCAAFAPAGTSVSIPPYAIRLPHSPLVAVEKIEYMDMDGSWKPVPDTDYSVNPDMCPPIITPRFGKVWPIPLPQSGSVRVTYVAGYASPIMTGGTLASNQFRVNGPVSYQVGCLVRFYNSGGVLPAPLSADVNYTVATVAGPVYTLTDDTGAAVTLTQPGTGRNYIGVVPDAIRAWMLLRVGAMYEFREEAAVIERGSVVAMPFVDGLLDPFISGLI